MTQDIMKYRYTDGKPNLRRFHQASWDEPVIFELSEPGQRGVLGEAQRVHRTAKDELQEGRRHLRDVQRMHGWR